MITERELREQEQRFAADDQGDEAAPEYHALSRAELKSLLMRRKPAELESKENQQ
jgi:hypothetical protein